MTKTMDGLGVNTMAVDAVQRASSGHPGTPMTLAPVVYCQGQRVVRVDLRQTTTGRAPQSRSSRLSRAGAAGRGDGPGLGGAGGRGRLGAVRRPPRPQHRHGAFGASAPLKELQKKSGFVPESIMGAAQAPMARARR